VGTTAPSFPLEVRGTARVNGQQGLSNKLFVLWDNNTSESLSTATDFYGFGINSGVLRHQVSVGGVHSFFIGTSHVARFNGNGGNFSSLLLSNSSMYAHMTASNSVLYMGNSSANGVQMAAGATAWSAISDARLKTNVRPLEYGLTSLSLLEPVRFDYLADSNALSNSKRIGFIAQNVLTSVPEAVSGSEADRYAMSPTDLIPVCVNAIKELRTQMETVLTQMEAMRAFLSSKFPGEFMG
jgi:hypothetical protein